MYDELIPINQTKLPQLRFLKLAYRVRRLQSKEAVIYRAVDIWLLSAMKAVRRMRELLIWRSRMTDSADHEQSQSARL